MVIGSPEVGGVIVARFVGPVKVTVYTRGPHNPATLAAVAAESVAGTNINESETPLKAVTVRFVTSASERFVVKHGSGVVKIPIHLNAKLSTLLLQKATD